MGVKAAISMDAEELGSVELVVTILVGQAISSVGIFKPDSLRWSLELDISKFRFGGMMHTPVGNASGVPHVRLHIECGIY